MEIPILLRRWEWIGEMLSTVQYTNTAVPTNSCSPDGATFDAAIATLL